MNLIQGNNYSPTLNKEEVVYVLSSEGKRVSEIEKQEVSIFLVECLTKIKFEAGHRTENETEEEKERLVAMVNSVYLDLKTKFYALTLKEIQNAFRLGVRKEYGEYMGVNPVTIYGWLKAYVNDSKRNEAKKKQAEYLDSLNKPKQISEEEKESIMVKACLKAFEEKQKGVYFNDIGNSCYNFLDKKGVISLTKERKEAFIEKAKEICKQNLLNALHKEFGNKNEIKKTLIQIETEVVSVVIVEAKKIAINTYFEELIELGETLTFETN